MKSIATKPSGYRVLSLEQDTPVSKVSKESDSEIMERMRERFQILEDMTRAVKKGDVRAMIVSGPPGVGKSFGVERVLARHDVFADVANDGKLKKKKRKENLRERKKFQKKKNTLRKSLDTLLMTSWNQNPQLQVKSKQEKLKESKVPRLKLMRSPRIKLKQRFKINISSNPSLKLQMQALWISDSKPKPRRLQEEEITEEEEEEEEVEEVEEMFKKEVMLKLLKEEEENQTQKLL